MRIMTAIDKFYCINDLGHTSRLCFQLPDERQLGTELHIFFSINKTSVVSVEVCTAV